MESGHSKLIKGTEGAVFVEFLVAFLPVLTMFLCLLQVALLFSIRLVVEHAAVNSARAAAVVIGDDPKAYSGQVEPLNEILPNSGARYNAIRRAAILTLAPLIVDGTIRSVDVFFPPSNQPGGTTQSRPKWNPMDRANIDKVRVSVRVDAACKIAIANRIACSGWRVDRESNKWGINIRRPGQYVRAEAVFPYQGASYSYQ